MDRQKIEKIQRFFENLGLVAVVVVLIFAASVTFTSIVSATHNWAWGIVGVSFILSVAGALYGVVRISYLLEGPVDKS